ncbi:MAG: manganese efflux pump [Clostridiales bacterium]|nr:manganese efflux pump [Clostridiales bacterium]
MGLLELFLIAVGLSMDAFAVSVCAGLTMSGITYRKMLVFGLYFGGFQAGMPLVGYFLGSRFADGITAFDHWIAFALLVFIGTKMITGSLKKEGCADRHCPEEMCSDRPCPGKRDTAEASLRPSKMLPLAVATSIDALAVGVSFAFLHVNIVPAVSFIGVITFILSVAGVKIGNVFGLKFKSKAELLGGIILVVFGFEILLEHLGVLSF